MKNKLYELVAIAEAVAAAVENPEFKKVAFERVLQHLLGEQEFPAGTARAMPRDSRNGASSTRRTRRTTGTAKKKKKNAVGPMAWLEELITEGVFTEPRSGAAIVAALKERGHHLVYQDLTQQLSRLTKDRKLRRIRLPVAEGRKRQVWHYVQR